MIVPEEVIYMNIPALSVSMSRSELGIDLGTALMAKVLDTVEDAGAALEEMIETAVIPELGENIDIRV